jgi:hypothetical protein
MATREPAFRSTPAASSAEMSGWAAWPLFWAGMALAAGGTVPALANAPGRSRMGKSVSG